MPEVSRKNFDQGETTREKRRIRIAVSLLYFCLGFCFSSWASRIPDIKTSLNLSDGALGSILFALPVGQLLMMPFSGRLVTRFGSHKTILIALPAYSLLLNNIGLVKQGWHLALALFLFGLAGNLCNISVNTQGVSAEKLQNRPIMGTFHGVWSLSGFTGALTGLLMINLKIIPQWHFAIVTIIVWTVFYFIHNHLVKIAPGISTEEPGKLFFNKPDTGLLQLGIICFFCMACEGAMFDWSGVYFRDVVKVHPSIVVLGYTSFMIMMATGRFMADRISAGIGRRKHLQISGIVISTGLFISVFFPYLITCTIAFMLVGLGVSGVIPTVYSTTGRHSKVPPGIALATVASVGFLGFLMGPPLIGHISELAGLRYSFTLIGFFGLGITLMVTYIKVFHEEIKDMPPVKEEQVTVQGLGELP